MKKTVLCMVVVMCLIFVSAPAFAAGSIFKCKSQTVLVPGAYFDRSYMKDGEMVPIVQDSGVTIVNLDLNHDITVLSVRFIKSDGTLIKEFAPDPLVLAPLEAAQFYANYLTLGIDHFPFFPGVTLYYIVEWKGFVRVRAPGIGGMHLFLLMDGDDPMGHRQLTIVPHGGAVIKEKKGWWWF